ncbi:PilZ domain-containing protein [Neobacillus jeddahensis]|uniref:PilZ domain-containing protein n=1 Tax=Neobacillus jeddahensis TaxID=1461580 RepID=UPI000590F1B1|nr:PilZ domain-containing protein [Neobacillus jeddahensis]
MSDERRQYGRVDFDTTIQLMIVEPVSQRAELNDASNNGLRIVTEADFALNTVITCLNIELENSIPFTAKIVWKKQVDTGKFQYGLHIEE